jgi:hypothetical protein
MLELSPAALDELFGCSGLGFLALRQRTRFSDIS